MSPNRADYAIGTVSSLTGLDPHTIRAWERRHRAVVPGRSETGRRLYCDADVERLRLLRSATEAGHAIGSVAHRPDEELRELLTRHRADPERGPGPLRVFLQAPELRRQIQFHTGGCTWDVLPPSELPPEQADVAIFELAALGHDPVRAISETRRAAPQATVVVLYAFGRRALLAQLARVGCRLVRAPVRLPALEQAIEGWAPAPPLPEPPPERSPVPGVERRFDEDQLARLLETPGSIACECPSHLASLVRSALAFEAYTRECEDLTAEDAEIHRELGGGITRVRVELEQLLAHLCAHEGLRI